MCENIHQKMKSCVGSWNVGVETSHYLLLLLSFRYNISTSIKRCGKPDFGHPHISLIDRLQLRIQQIYNVLVWPNHTNILQFKPVENFASIGIGELNYSNLFTEKGEPDKRIKKAILDSWQKR